MSQPKIDEGKRFTWEDVKKITAEYGIELATSTTFTPAFNQNVFVMPPPVQINPYYCSSIRSAADLMSILQDLKPVGYLDWPSPFSPGSPFYFSAKVPWIAFENGAIRNAGQLAFYWLANSGESGGKIAEKNARLDIAFG